MDELNRLLKLIERRCQAWPARAWSSPAGPGTRADAVFAAVQALADLGAGIEGRRRQAVPRLEDPVLPDQLAVMVHDLSGTAAAARAVAILAELAVQVGIRA